MSTSQTPTVPEAFERHGFGVLCVRDAGDECFMIVPADESGAAELAARGVRLWVPATEAAVAAQLLAAGFSQSDTDAAIAHAREWTTTITRQPGAPRVLWGLSGQS